MANALPSTSATGRKQLNIRLTLRHYGAADIVRGNIELAALRPVAALNIYTEVLAKTSTGHPVAFLNRSLCYLLLGYPSLAVYDAHRAFLGGRWALEDHVDVRTLTRQIVSYGYHVEKALATDKTSLTALCRFVGGGAVSWLNTDLAALILEPLPVGIKANEAEWYFTNDVIMKAYWRLAYSLWKCGGGAMRTALEVLADARSRSYRLWEERRPSSGSRNKTAPKPGQLFFDTPLDEYPPLEGYFWAFTELENRIMTEIDQSGSEVGTKGLLGTRYTKVRRELYPWDQISLTTENIDRNLQVLNAHFRDLLSSCEIKAFLEDGKAVKARLYATEGSDTPAGTCLCMERSNLHVTSGDDMTGHTLCHSCAAVLTGPVASIKASNKTHRDGLQPYQQDPSLVPWSYETNVRHPIHALFTNGGPDLALDITNFDGWVFNTVAAKLEAAMRITRAPRFEKFFDNDGRLIGQRVAAAPQAEDSESVWIGSIHPLATLIDVARPGERANTRLYERGGTVVAYADTDHPDPATAPVVPGKIRLDSVVGIPSPLQRAGLDSLIAKATRRDGSDTEMVDVNNPLFPTVFRPGENFYVHPIVTTILPAPPLPAQPVNNPPVAIPAGAQLLRDDALHPLPNPNDLAPGWTLRPPRPRPHRSQLASRHTPASPHSRSHRGSDATSRAERDGDSMLDASVTDWTGEDEEVIDDYDDDDDSDFEEVMTEIFETIEREHRSRAEDSGTG
ncbi:hypothetical protein H2199_003333 [Coniosporium tulheliwenetii]|uniref:Uncharacterized protein n=1 Tax=Coniosporium tulheliwenetii TaxID=3383036 RepID=A0ACC2ZC17_9PEZI|nr:hypothetical protein H2199_003333 [Cladosporium sp. JES 115]